METEPKIISNQMVGDTKQIYIETCPMVCSREIAVFVRNEIIEKVEYCGGCSGNTQGIAMLLKGMSVADAISKLKGTSCNGKGTSCPDQLARGLEKVYNH